MCFAFLHLIAPLCSKLNWRAVEDAMRMGATKSATATATPTATATFGRHWARQQLQQAAPQTEKGLMVHTHTHTRVR